MNAAERKVRPAVLLEIDRAYVDVIVRRWEATSGGEVALVKIQSTSRAAIAAF